MDALDPTRSPAQAQTAEPAHDLSATEPELAMLVAGAGPLQADTPAEPTTEPAGPITAAPRTATQRPRPERVAVHGNIQTDAEHQRKIKGLELQRERILSERTSNPHRRSALANALTDIEEKLAELGWTVHL